MSNVTSSSSYSSRYHLVSDHARHYGNHETWQGTRFTYPIRTDPSGKLEPRLVAGRAEQSRAEVGEKERSRAEVRTKTSGRASARSIWEGDESTWRRKLSWYGCGLLRCAVQPVLYYHVLVGEHRQSKTEQRCEVKDGEGSKTEKAK